jgi:Transcriptional regulators
MKRGFSMDLKIIFWIIKYWREYETKHYKYSGELNATEFAICVYVLYYSGTSQNSIVMAFDSHKTTIGKALKNLEEKGYICRTINPDDRREKKVSLSEYGMNKFAEVLRIQKEWETVLETKLTKEESNDFNRICRILCDEARKMVEHDEMAEDQEYES